MNILTMLEAKAQGKTRYFTGNPCPHGHIAERMVSTRGCIGCIYEKKHKWSENNPEKVNAQKRAWRDANLEKARKLNLDNQKKHRAAANARNRRYMEANRERCKERWAEYAKRNPEKTAARMAKRRAAKMKQVAPWIDHQAVSMIYRAAQVLRISGFDVHVDHEIPLQGLNVSGLHVHTNLKIIDAKRNQSKSNHF